MRLRTLTSFIALGIFALAAPLAMAAEARPDGDPKALVQQRYEAIMEAAQTAEDQAALTESMTAILDLMIDYEGFSARTLKGTWDTLKSGDKKKFKELFKKLVIRTYAKRFKPRTVFEVSYRGETKFDDEAPRAPRAIVQTTVKGKKVAADVDYSFHAVDADGGPEWQAYDIVIDEVSMALNWRKQFKNIIKKKGFPALLAKIEKKVEKSGDEDEK